MAVAPPGARRMGGDDHVAWWDHRRRVRRRETAEDWQCVAGGRVDTRASGQHGTVAAQTGLAEGSTAVPLHRSRKHKMIAGVCGGISEWLGWDPTVVRILYVLVSVLSVAFPGILVYVILWFLMPKAPE